jgi:hypothetical protein
LLGVRPPHFIELRVRPSALFPKTAEGATPDRGGHFSLLSVALDACPLESDDGDFFRFSGCLVQRVGRMSAEGFGFRESASSAELYYTLGISGAAAFWFAPPFGLRVGVDLEAPLTRDAYFSIGSTGERHEIFRPSPVVGAATAGMVLAL